MLPRIGSAALLIAAVLGALLFDSVWLYGAAAVVVAAGLFEYSLLTRALGTPAPLWLLLPLGLVLLLRDRLPPAVDLTLLLAVTTVLGLGVWVFLADWRSSLVRWALALGGSLYIGYLFSFYLALYFRHQPDPNHLGFGLIVFVFGAIWTGDTVALVVGTRFGRTRFFPRISPHKTVEGALGGLIASSLVFALFAPIVDISWPHNLLLGLLIGVFAQIGDLIESQLKRSAGVKDASQLIPGHGGVLDRIDSLIPVGAVVYYYLQVMRLP